MTTGRFELGFSRNRPREALLSRILTQPDNEVNSAIGQATQLCTSQQRRGGNKSPTFGFPGLAVFVERCRAVVRGNDAPGVISQSLRLWEQVQSFEDFGIGFGLYLQAFIPAEGIDENL
jgi:hypothetical protein